ncbi:MAG: hypothetical protein AB7I36_10290 [Rhodospirillaceae bacterium]
MIKKSPADEYAYALHVIAANRTVVVAERTYAARIRTGIAMLAFGLETKALLGSQPRVHRARNELDLNDDRGHLSWHRGMAPFRIRIGASTPDVLQIARSILAGFGNVFLLVVAFALYVLWGL